MEFTRAEIEGQRKILERNRNKLSKQDIAAYEKYLYALETCVEVDEADLSNTPAPSLHEDDGDERLFIDSVVAFVQRLGSKFTGTQK